MLSSVFIDKRRKSTIAYFNDRSRPERRFDPINERIRYPEVLVIGPNGESLGRMSSQEANKVADEHQKAIAYHDKVEPKLEMEYLPRKIMLPGEGTMLEPINVAKHHLDANHHVNNGQYVRMAMEMLEEDIEVRRLRVEYKAQARLGDGIYPVYYKNGSVYVVSLNDKESNPYAVVEFTVQIPPEP